MIKKGLVLLVFLFLLGGDRLFAHPGVRFFISDEHRKALHQFFTDDSVPSIATGFINGVLPAYSIISGRDTIPLSDTIPAKGDSVTHGAARQSVGVQAAKDTIPLSDDSIKPAKAKAPHSPRKATIRSAIIPGWGQIYNKKYWKVPIVYAALGITGYVFFDNIKTYKDVRFAYDVTVSQDTASWDKVAPYLRVFVENNASSSLDNYRREFRRNIDYSVLVFLLFWGLNVVDATVDGHLKDFDVSPELSMKLKPLLPNNSYQMGVGNTMGLSLVFDIHKAKPGKLFDTR